MTNKQVYEAVWSVLSEWRPGMSDHVKHTLAQRIADRVCARADA